MMINRFYKYAVLVVSTLLLLEVGQGSSFAMVQAKNDSLRFEVLLSSKMLQDIHLNITFTGSQEMTANDLILLASGNQFYVLGWGGIKSLGPKVADTIRSFTYTPDGFLMIVRNKELCYIDSIGNLVKLLGLPAYGMGMAAGQNALYLYDQDKNKKKHALYILEAGGKYKQLLTVPAPIHAVAERKQYILFASENTLFSYHPQNKELKALATLPKEEQISALAIDSTGNTIYFSTDHSIYTLSDERMINLTHEFGGTLRCFKEGLLVFNPEKKFLVRIMGLEDRMASKIQELKTVPAEKQQEDLLTNETIVGLVKSKLSDGLIINLINRSRVDFNLSIDSMIYLSSQNVTSTIIMAMKNAMKKTTNGEPLNKSD